MFVAHYRENWVMGKIVPLRPHLVSANPPGILAFSPGRQTTDRINPGILTIAFGRPRERGTPGLSPAFPRKGSHEWRHRGGNPRFFCLALMNDWRRRLEDLLRPPLKSPPSTAPASSVRRLRHPCPPPFDALPLQMGRRDRGRHPTTSQISSPPPRSSPSDDDDGQEIMLLFVQDPRASSPV
ncbi:hypothetical protein VPH35_001581 [Triticum aestivum]